VTRMDLLSAATALQDLRSPPGNRLKAQRGDMRGMHAIRVNDEWRLVFRWSEGDAHAVRLTDYHEERHAASRESNPHASRRDPEQGVPGAVGITQVALAAHIGVPVQRVNELVRGKRGVTPDTAWLLAQAFETTPDFWLNLQAAYDLARTRPARTIAPLKSAS
jgi:antitoxin HigA-1